jgi:hypothetical protein
VSLELSGSAWVARFPTTRDPNDLIEPFHDRWAAYAKALTDAGARITYSAVYRPAERAYLMHYAWMITLGMDPAAVPPMEGVDIQWVHPGDTPQQSAAASRAAARLMVAGYGMAHAAVLVSRHTQRRAVDVSISWEGSLVLRLPSGSTATIPQGAEQTLWKVAADQFQVYHLWDDHPHYSDDGH